MSIYTTLSVSRAAAIEVLMRHLLGNVSGEGLEDPIVGCERAPNVCRGEDRQQ